MKDKPVVDATPGSLRVGWAMADLTPTVPVHMAGWSFLRVSEGVMDPIMAAVLVLESVGDDGAGDMLIMLGCDLARAEEALCSRVRELVATLQPAITGTFPRNAPWPGTPMVPYPRASSLTPGVAGNWSTKR